MCTSCGCSMGEAHSHSDHEDHSHEPSRLVSIEERVLSRNDETAALNRRHLKDREIVSVNLMSSPGAGKTTLLERTIRRFLPQVPVAVIEGDQETDEDARRIRETGCPAIQINTGTGCHLDAVMISQALEMLAPARRSLLFIENVGNLVCPALFDLGERAKVLIASVTEGEDKPLKYPHMFRAADVVLLNKIDLLPHLRFDVSRFRENARKVNGRAPVVLLSAAGGDGMEEWYGWLRILVNDGAA